MGAVALRVTPQALLKPRIQGLLNGWRKADGRQKFAYTLFGLFGLAFWIGLFVGLGYVVDLFYSVEVFGPLITRKLLELLLLALFSMLLFSNVVTALSSFYLSDDLELLLSLPVSRETFFYTRLLDTLGQSSWMMAMFGVPVFLSFGLAADAGWAYYASLAAVIPCFLLIPAATGATVSSVLVNGFSAKRTKEVLAVVGILFLVTIFILLRVMQPERLLNAQDFESLAAYVATLQSPLPALAPPGWAGDVLGASLQGRPYPFMQLALLVTGAIGFTGLSRWITMRLWADGWTRAQEASAARLAKAGRFHRTLKWLTKGLPAQQATLLIKDIKVFVRDPAQWSQVFLLISLVIIYTFSVQSLPVDVDRGPYLQSFKNAIAFLNLGMAGFVMAAIAVRFQFASISGEGRAFWLIRTAPIDPVHYLWTKAFPGWIPMLVIGQTLVIASNVILGSPPELTAVGVFTTFIMSFGVSGIAIGVGALYPDFKADNVARAAAGPGAILFMVGALFLIAVVIALHAVPVFYLLKADLEGASLTTRELGISALLYIASTGVCACAAWFPIRRAAAGLWGRDL
ncbi:MAG: hypothetical protein GY913_09680 [Proteobacteria bacterium]|nr:hypothetical protein [Pseudomonadota bacterium]